MITLLSLIFVLFTFNYASAQAVNITDRDEISVRVTHLADMLRDGYADEVKETRGIHIYSRGNETRMAVAIFAVEGFAMGNNATQYMAVFAVLSEESEGHPRRYSLLDVMAVGGKGWRSVDDKKVSIVQKKNLIVISLSTLEYGPKDAMCCPGRKSTAKYGIMPTVGGRLRELRKQ